MKKKYEKLKKIRKTKKKLETRKKKKIEIFVAQQKDKTKVKKFREIKQRSVPVKRKKP